jgi:hypothetical protein
MAGADPSFTETHLIRTLFILESGQIGRKRLVKLLGVGEGSVRTIIRKLAAEGLVACESLGHSLTDSGRRHTEKMLKKMTKPVEFDSGGLVGGVQSLVIVFGAASRVGSAVNLRDSALKAGADGAVILVKDGNIRFPNGGMDLSTYPQALERLEGHRMRDGDAAVIGFADTLVKAEDGAVAAAMILAGI